MKNRQLLKIAILAGFSICLSTAYGYELKSDVGCLTYALKDATDRVSGKFPSLEDWVRRVVNVENFTLKMKLDSSAQEKLFSYHLKTIQGNQSKATELANFVLHICSKDISPYEVNILGLNLKQIVNAND